MVKDNVNHSLEVEEHYEPDNLVIRNEDDLKGTDKKDYWWDISVPQSYNRLFNFIVGPRGPGKSYGGKKHGMKRFVEGTGGQFGYIRRTQAEIDRTNEKFFNDVQKEECFEGYDFDIKGDQYLVDGRIMGYSFALSTSLSIKSAPTPDIDYIIFDEFTVDERIRGQRYLKEEIYLLLHLYDTIVRPMPGKPPVPIYLLGNLYSIINPYFLSFNLRVPKNKKMITTRGDVLLQYVENPDFIEAKNSTRFAKVANMVSKDYGKTSFENRAVRDDNDFIRKAPKRLKYMFTIKAGGEHYGVSVALDEGIYYVSSKYDKSCKLIYTTLLDNHEPNVLLLKGAARSELWERFRRVFKLGVVWYDNLKTKTIVIESIKHCI